MNGNGSAQLAVIGHGQQQVVPMQQYAMQAEELKGQVQLIQQVMRAVMKQDEHYGVIPGCGNKPVLLKPGAEKLSMTFRFAPEFVISERDLGRGHREYSITTTLRSIVTGAVIGQGVGSCSTMESKFRFRKAEQTCPECGEATIIKGKQEYGGGWLCYKKKGGCGAKFQDGDERIENQEMGRIEHDNPADYYNTCLKMAKKRSHVDAVLTATAASDIFTQDIEDDPSMFGGRAADPEHAPQRSTSRQQTKPSRTQQPQQQAPDFDMNDFQSEVNACTTVTKLQQVWKQHEPAAKASGWGKEAIAVVDARIKEISGEPKEAAI